jgi:hypothetical protein
MGLRTIYSRNVSYFACFSIPLTTLFRLRKLFGVQWDSYEFGKMWKETNFAVLGFYPCVFLQGV